jgi:hypothetical protein
MNDLAVLYPRQYYGVSGAPRPRSGTGERLSAIFFATSSGMLGKTTTRQLQVPFEVGALELKALVSSGLCAVLSW